MHRTARLLFYAILPLPPFALLLLTAASPHRPPAASFGGETAGDDEAVSRAFATTILPWQALSEPAVEVVRVANILDGQSGPRREKRDQLLQLAQNLEEPPLVRGLAAFGAGVILLEEKRVGDAVEMFQSPAISETALRDYALYFTGRELEDKDAGAARQALERAVGSGRDFALIEEARLLLGRLLAEAGEDEKAEEQFRAVLASSGTGGKGHLEGEALLELSDVLTRTGRKQEAAALLEKLYYEMPLSRFSREALPKLNEIRKVVAAPSAEESYRLAFRRAEKLYESGLYAEAYSSYTALLKRFPGQVDRDLLNLRRGICLYHRRQSSAALRVLEDVDRPDLKPEALYYRAECSRRLRRHESYRDLVDELLRLAPSSSWAEEGLWSLVRHYVVEDEPDRMLASAERLAESFPRGRYSLDAQWRVLWAKYRAGRFEEAAAGFERAAREHPGESDLPRFLYFAGRSYEKLGREERASALYRQVLFGYRNTYYGRQAGEGLARLQGENAPDRSLDEVWRGIDLGDALRVLDQDRVTRIGQLLAVGLQEEAVLEAERGARQGGEEAGFLAVAAWIHSLRDRHFHAITAMQRAFPFHSSATGDLLPRPVWEILYPLRYWEFIERYSREHELDPYLVAALIRQESTFNPVIRSSAGARGLMQIMPATGRSLARQHRRAYRLADLTHAEINIQYGTHYLRQVLDRFGGRLDYALASYNAGPHRVRAWTGMDLTIDPEVFIEEIPFTETRNYVKLVLRNEMLYRRIYAGARETAAE